MASRGVATCVVTYRLPNGHSKVPLTDVQNAFRYCRYHAKEWGVNQIGVMGFSAGGHLAASASTLYVDEITKPDFSVLIYPVIDLDHHKGTCDALVGKSRKLKKEFSLQNRITSDTPRTFLALSQNDNVVDIHSSLYYFENLIKSSVKAEMYIFPSGGRGYGFLNEEVGGRTDKLGVYRPVFSAALEKYLQNVMVK
jgi:Esterase/lipase